MAHVDESLGETELDLCGEAQETEVVGDGSTLLAHTGSQLLLLEVMEVQDLLVG